MPNWLLKAGAQGAISLLPRHQQLNAAFQRRVTRTATLAQRQFESKRRHAERHLRHYASATGSKAPPKSAFELGTGWYPVIPVALALAGVERVVTFDIHGLADGARVRTVLERFEAAGSDDPRLAQGLAADPASPHAQLAPLGVELQVAPSLAEAAHGESFDLLVSNNTLEHIPLGALREVMNELARLSASRAVMDHFIDMRDHYATFDRSLNRLNFLRYPDPVWRLFNNRLQFQNRLRLPDYRALVEAAGFSVMAERRVEGREGEFDGLKLARHFRDMPRADALVLYAWVTARAPL